MYHCNNKPNDRWYKGDNYCIYLEKFVNFKKGLQKDKQKTLQSKCPLHQARYRDRFFKSSSIYRIFSKELISETDIKEAFDSIVTAIGDMTIQDVEMNAVLLLLLP